MDKEIKEMTHIIKGALDVQFGCGDTVDIGDKEAAAELAAQDLIKANYCKADEVRKEAAKKCMRIVKHELEQTQNKELVLSLSFILGEIATEFGLEVQ